MKFYKVLNDGKACSGGNFDYSPYLPGGEKSGEWTPEIEYVVLCENGYHVTDAIHLIDFLDGNQCFVCERRGIGAASHEKSAWQSIRFITQIEGWNDKNLRLFACWCAEQALPLFEEQYPTDYRPRLAIEASRKFANGEITEGELAAARDAAWVAARAAAWVAARDAAWVAARDAARDAARAAAWDAQSKKLLEFVGIEDGNE